MVMQTVLLSPRGIELPEMKYEVLSDLEYLFNLYLIQNKSQ